MLKQVVIAHKLNQKRKQLAGLTEKRDAIKARKDEMKKREEELEAAVQEITEETADEAKTAVEEAVAEFEEAAAAVEAEAAENDKAIEDLEAAIGELQGELDEIASKVEEAAAEVDEKKDEASDERSKKIMNTRDKFFGMTAEQKNAFFAREDVKKCLAEVRTAMAQKRAITGGALTIPTVMLDLIRDETAKASKLLPYVRLRSIAGKGRQNVLGDIPEAVWTEMCANINEITLVFNQVEVDGYKVGAYVAVCNALLEDSDENLAGEIVTAFGAATGKALDKAILFGTGTKMPIGIATRLAATSQPSWWGTNDPAFTDLHTSNIQTLNINSSSGAAFFIALVAKLAIAKPKYNADGLFWAMNRKTHLDIMAKALAFDASAALVSNTEFMPVVGGTVVEFEDDQLADYEIIGGFGGNYLLAERAGMEVASSDLPLFLQDQTVFKATSRYDGKPLCGEAFVIVNYNNTTPTTEKDFAPDDANSVQSIQLNTHAATVVGTGTVQLQAVTAPGKGTVTWATSASANATVSSTGLVTGVTTGSAVITATCNGLTDSCTVTVSAG